MKPASGLHLRHIREAATQIETYLEGVERETFLAQPLLQDAVAMRFVIIGEAASKLLQIEPDLVADVPGVPWSQMRGLRNRLVQGYAAIDHDAVWDTARLFLPRLMEALSRIEIPAPSREEAAGSHDES